MDSDREYRIQRSNPADGQTRTIRTRVQLLLRPVDRPNGAAADTSIHLDGDGVSITTAKERYDESRSGHGQSASIWRVREQWPHSSRRPERAGRPSTPSPPLAADATSLLKEAGTTS